jgi:hypothetical protein
MTWLSVRPPPVWIRLLLIDGTLALSLASVNQEGLGDSNDFLAVPAVNNHDASDASIYQRMANAIQS